MADPQPTLDGAEGDTLGNIGDDTPGDVLARVDAWMQTLDAAEGATLVRAPLSTIEPAQVDTGADRRANAQLTPMARSSRVRLETLLGEGGMGVVYLAEQESLGRKVAVKKVRAEVSSSTATTRLLQEAWVTGQLEHPNILPVYDISTSDAGEALIVLKRIDGVEWGDLMGAATQVARRFRAKDLLEWNLDVLMHVCDAVHFAHSRGFIHRDIKPENVLIGELGEVYLADWGIAVSTRDDQSIVPLARDATQIAGTPAYMAPEMLGGEAPRICAQTDVYLLGAVLHEILTGQPPHQGAELRDMLKSIITGVGELPESVPEALRNICRRALANDPDARFETPLQLKLALEGYLRHRGSQRLGERALERLDELLVCIERAEKLTPEERRQRGEEVLQEIHGLISECRFGFREALAQWPENRAAQAGLRRALEVMTAHEARIGDAKAARAYLAQLEDPDPALVAMVERAEAERAQQAARLVELEKHHDIRTGMRTRTFMAALMGLLWTGLPIAGGEWLAARYEWAAVSYTTLSAVTYACIALLLGLGYWARESMMSTPMNRRFFGAIVALLVLQRGFVAVCEAHALPMDQAFTLLFAFWTSLAVLQAISMHLGLFVTALGYGLATLLSVYYPGSNLRILAAANFVFTANLIWLGMPVLREDHRDRLARAAQAEGAKRPEA